MLYLNLIVTALTLLACSSSCFATDVFRPKGSDSYYSIDAAALVNTPQWKPPDGVVPLSATDAIRVAKKYHDSLKFTGFLRLHRWAFHRATLTSAPDNRWYWVITFRGPFGPTLSQGPGGHSYPGARTLYNHYPVLMTGAMPDPIQESETQKQLRRERFLRDFEDDKSIFDYNGEWPLPSDSGSPESG